MNTETIAVIITTLPLIIAAVANLIISVRNGAKVDAVHVLSNSQLTKVTDSLKQANEKIERLETIITAKKTGNVTPFPSA